MAKTVLVTGANGFIASHVVSQLLAAGYTVVGTVRSQSSADKVKKLFPSDKLTLAITPDIVAEGAFDEAVKGIDAAIHVASPFTLAVESTEKDLLLPAIKGTENLLESVNKNAPNCERVVITSSFAAMVDFSQGARGGYAYSEKDWNPITYDYAKDADPVVGYLASKALGEKAGWDYIAAKKPKFSLASICSPMVFGPSIHDVSLTAPNVTTWDLNRFFSGELSEPPNTDFWGFVDVRDAAKAHIRAIEVPEAANERFFVVAGRYSYQQTADVLRASPKIPEDAKAKIPVGKPGENYPSDAVYDVDNSKSKKVLGLEYRSFEECTVDAGLRILELRKNL